VAVAVSLLARASGLPGLGKLWDQFGPQDGARKGWLSGREIAVILLPVIFGIALSFSTAARRVHDIENVERQGSGPVRVHLQMPAGDLKVSAGASKLLEAGFKYAEGEGKPKISYQAGQLEIAQVGRKFHFGRTENTWDIHLGSGIPMELNIDVGAGQSQVKVGDLALTRLDMKMGAGQIIADLTVEKGSRCRHKGWSRECGHTPAGLRGRASPCHGRDWLDQRRGLETQRQRILQRLVWQVTGHRAP
jgi:hypothetical protein